MTHAAVPILPSAIILISVISFVAAQGQQEQTIVRLTGGRPGYFYQGIVEVFREGAWGAVCDLDRVSWGLQEANVTCRQLGFKGGVVRNFRLEDKTFDGKDFIATVPDDVSTVTEIVECDGDESELGECRIKYRGGCPRKDIVVLWCEKESYSACPAGSHPALGSCFSVQKEPKTFRDAQQSCKSKGATLVELQSQTAGVVVGMIAESVAANISTFWTGGVLNRIAGLDQVRMGFWIDSRSPIFYDTAVGEEVKDNEAKGVMLVQGEFHWSMGDLGSSHAYICESFATSIGCIDDVDDPRGLTYDGNASKTESGNACLFWNDFVDYGHEDRNHNYCRNEPEDEETAPWCVTEDGYDVCDIPKCHHLPVGRSSDFKDFINVCKSSSPRQNIPNFEPSIRPNPSIQVRITTTPRIPTSSITKTPPTPPPSVTVGVIPTEDTCSARDLECDDDCKFSCDNGECRSVDVLCDGNSDCTDGSDEATKYCEAPTQVRLVDQLGKDNTLYGRLEIRHKGIWGTVCKDRYFGQNEADVFCKMLGHTSSSKFEKNFKNSFPKGVGSWPVWINFETLNACDGNEGSIEECHDKKMWYHSFSCYHREDVILTCDSAARAAQHVRSDIVTADDIECGVVSDSLPVTPADQNQRVAGGTAAAKGSHPWQASLRVRGFRNQTFHQCGAAVISPVHVLTAAHCTVEWPENVYYVRVGDNVIEVSDGEVDVDIIKIYTHEDFNTGEYYLDNDIALIHVKPITFTQYIRPVCLPPTNPSQEKFLYSPGRNLTISGWGKTGYDTKDRWAGSNVVSRLNEATIPIIRPDICDKTEIYGDKISEGMFCAGFLKGGVDACEGDSGGPAVALVPGRGPPKATLVGLTSWGYGCGRKNKPGVYTRVVKYVPWILSKIEQTGESSKGFF